MAFKQGVAPAARSWVRQAPGLQLPNEGQEAASRRPSLTGLVWSVPLPPEGESAMTPAHTVHCFGIALFWPCLLASSGCGEMQGGAQIRNGILAAVTTELKRKRGMGVDDLILEELTKAARSPSEVSLEAAYGKQNWSFNAARLTLSRLYDLGFHRYIVVIEFGSLETGKVEIRKMAVMRRNPLRE